MVFSLLPVDYSTGGATFQLSTKNCISPEATVTMVTDSIEGFSTVAKIADDGPKGDKGYRIEVSCTTIQKIFDDNRLEVCDFLKMDCEGAEYEIFYNCPPEYLKRIRHLDLSLQSRK